MQLVLLGFFPVFLSYANPVVPPPQKTLLHNVSFQNTPQSKAPPMNTPLPKALPSSTILNQASSSKAPPPKVPSSMVPPPKVPSRKDTSCPSQYVYMSGDPATVWKAANSTAVFMAEQQSWRLQTANISRKPEDPSWRLDNGMSEYFGGVAGSNMNCGISDSDCSSPPGLCGDLKSPAGYQILSSMVTLNHILNNMHDGFHDAIGAVTPTIVNNGALLGTFGLSTNSPDIKILLAVLAAVLAFAGGILGAADVPIAAAVIGGIGPGTMGIAINALPPATPADLGSALATLDNAVDTAYKQCLYTYLEQLMEGSALLQEPIQNKADLRSSAKVGFCPNPNEDPTNPTLPCSLVDALPGGISDVLTGVTTSWAGFKLSDLITASVNTWRSSGKKNTGAPAINIDTPPSTYPSSIESLPFLNSIIVCDYTGNGDPGAGCPAITTPPPENGERAKVSGSPSNVTHNGVGKASTGAFKPAATQLGKAHTTAASGKPKSSRVAMPSAGLGPSGGALPPIHRGSARKPSATVGNLASMSSPHPFAPSFSAFKHSGEKS
ncbi:hypothetical protein MMC27_000078 [Xylographa pallens]|nr:hypothetical protein [Xylographa pallens]